MLIQTLYKLDNFSKLANEVNDIITLAGENHNQIMCQTLNPTATDWYNGVGRVLDLAIQDETAYKFINPLINNTELSEIIKRHNAFRTRIMIMQGRACYSIHADFTKRIHIPIITTEQAWMVWPHYSECHQLLTGNVYLTDTTKHHTFINGSLEKRIHIVMCINE